MEHFKIDKHYAAVKDAGYDTIVDVREADLPDLIAAGLSKEDAQRLQAGEAVFCLLMGAHAMASNQIRGVGS